MFWVVPLCGGALILFTYGISVRLGVPEAGLMAGWLTATSPTFLFMLLQPMSDVPVAAAWALAIWLALADGLRAAFGGGLAAALAVTIRPNLLPIVAIVGGWLAIQQWRAPIQGVRLGWRRAVAFGAGAAPGIVFTAWLNDYWYGSPFQSGYAPLEELFSWANLWPNLRRYGASLVSTQTAFAAAGLLAWFLPPRWLGLERRRQAQALAAAVVFIVWVEYCAYSIFEPWWYLRFMLPIWPLMMLGLGVLARRLVRNRGDVLRLAATFVVIGIGLHTLRWAIDSKTFSFRRSESKYAAVGKAARAHTSDNAVIFSGQHSGSLRYYAGRMTLAYFNVDPQHFRTAFSWIVAHGGHPYAVLERWEADEFRRRFGSEAPVAKLEMTPVMAYFGSETAYLYDLLPSYSRSEAAYYFEVRRPDRCPVPAPPAALVLK